MIGATQPSQPAPAGSLDPRLSPAAGAPRLAAAILLAGVIRPNLLRSAIARAVLDLPLEPERPLLRHWCELLAALPPAAAMHEVRVLLDRAALAPLTPPAPLPAQRALALQIERDRQDYRGSGGVLFDVARDYADDDHLLVATAARLWCTGLGDPVQALRQAPGDIVLLAAPSGTLSGLMLVRCGALRGIPAVGFIDFHEQALPQIAPHHAVTVVTAPVDSYPVRTHTDYTHALLQYHRHRQGLARAADPFREDWQPTFQVIEDPASVAPGARIHDAVVLRGARVEAGAVVVRSVVCPGGVVPRGATVVDTVVAPARPRRGGRDGQ